MPKCPECGVEIESNAGCNCGFRLPTEIRPSLLGVGRTVVNLCDGVADGTPIRIVVESISSHFHCVKESDQYWISLAGSGKSVRFDRGQLLSQLGEELTEGLVSSTPASGFADCLIDRAQAEYELDKLASEKKTPTKIKFVFATDPNRLAVRIHPGLNLMDHYHLIKRLEAFGPIIESVDRRNFVYGTVLFKGPGTNIGESLDLSELRRFSEFGYNFLVDFLRGMD